MSTAIAKNFQIGADSTPSNNFTLYQPASPDGTLRLGNGNTGITSSLLTLTSAGNLGIGTSSPGSYYAKNLVVGVADQGGITIASSPSAVETYLMFADGTSGTDAYTGYIGYSHTNNFMRFATNGGGERMRIDSAGNVGIGTSSPTVYGSYRTLEVRGTGGGLLQLGTGATTAAYVFQDGTNAGFNNIANGVITFGTNNTERARIDSSGNFLIGGTTANGRLDVAVPDGTTNALILERTGASPASLAVTFANQFANLLSSGVMTFATNGTERGRFDTSGNFQFNSGYGSVATAFGCRAWVNFNGVGTVAIRASGNVSSITDNGTGDYTVNFTTAMPDANYAVECTTSQSLNSVSQEVRSLQVYADVSMVASNVRVLSKRTIVGGSTSEVDGIHMFVSIFR